MEREGMASQDSAGGMEGTGLFTYVWKAYGGTELNNHHQIHPPEGRMGVGQVLPLLHLLLFTTSFTVN